MKTTALLLLLSCISLRAQSSPSGGSTAGDEELRNALRQTVGGTTNRPAAPKTARSSSIAAPASESLPASPAPAATETTPATPPTVPDSFTPPAAVAPPASETAVSTPETNAPAQRTPPRRNTRRTNAPPADVVATAEKPAAPSEDIIAAGQINFTAAELTQVLDLYSKLVNRTILRAPGLPAPTIALKSQTALTRKEGIEALEAVLALNGVTLINIGDKFVKAVPVAQADGAGAAIRRDGSEGLPEMGQHVTQIVHLRFAKPSEVASVLQAFGNTKSVLAVDSSGILVIRDYSENVKRMLEMVEEIDAIPQTEIVSEVIPIKYAMAVDIASALSAVSGQPNTTSVGAQAAPRQTTAPGAGNTGLAGGGNRLGTQGGYQGARPTTPAGTPSAATSFQGRLQSIINRAAGTPGDVQILGQTKIIADERTNSLLVFATRQDMATIKDIISKLDVVLAQVLIEAIIMEVSLNSSLNLGISYLQAPRTSGQFSGAGAINNGNMLDLNSFVSGVTNAIPNPPGGFSYFASFGGGDLDVTATAIAGDGRVNVLSRPSIQTSHAVPANLFIGNTVPYITGTTYGDFSGATSRSVYEEKQVGISMIVTPLINPEGLVVMEITQDIEQLGTPTQIDGNDVPTTSKRSASAKVAVKDRDTIILGGFITNTKTTSRSGVPLLKDIPLLGYLFRSTIDSGNRVELVVLLRPTVLPTPDAAARVAIEKRNNLPGIRRAEAEQNREEQKLLRKADRKSAREPIYDDVPPTQ